MSRLPRISSAAAESQTKVLPVAELRALLAEFERKFAPKAPAENPVEQNKALLRGFQTIRHAWEKSQVYEAEGFLR
jgi:hypothetical protein